MTRAQAVGGRADPVAELGRAESSTFELTIRRSSPADRSALTRLAQLDNAPEPAGDYLVAEEHGELRAALPLDGGRPFADPFHRTADLVAMLELRARRVRMEPAAPRRRGLRHRADAAHHRRAAVAAVGPAGR